MRKRRVGVTARSRQIEQIRETGTVQIASEIAAPLELRTPKGTAVKTASRVRMEVWRQRRRSEQSAESVESQWQGKERRRAGGAHEAPPHTRPGGKPPETPSPFPSQAMLENGENLSRVRKPRNYGALL